MTTTDTRLNPLDAAMPAELLDRGRQALSDLEALLPAAVAAAVLALEVTDDMAANGHGLSDDEFNQALPGSVWGAMTAAGARLAAVVDPNRPAGGRTHLQDMARAIVAAPVPVLDEVRCRRLVIVDEDGVERIVSQASAHGAATLRVQSGDPLTGTWAELASMHERDGVNASCYVSVGGDIVGVLDGIGHDNGASGHLATASFDGADSAAAVDVRIGSDGITGRAVDQ